LAERAQPGLREVLLVAGGAAAVVLGAAVATGWLPEGIQRIIFHGPVTIVVLIVGTAWVLWRVANRRDTGAP
jgi:hypothetical protein